MIRIRAYNTKTQEMFLPEELAEDQMTLLPTGEFINVSGANTKLSVIYPTTAMIPMLSTGLFDMHFEEIFDGDLMRSNYDNEVSLVEMREGVWESGGAPLTAVQDRQYVIGNIHENKDLLKR